MPIVALGLAWSLAGCAAPAPKEEIEPPQQRPTSPRTLREHMLQAAWNGHSYHSLVAAFGTPHAILTVPGRNATKTIIVVFGVRDRMSNCIDAFTIVDLDKNQNAVVANYFCR